MKYLFVRLLGAASIAFFALASADGCKDLDEAIDAGNTGNGTSGGGRTKVVPNGAKPAQKADNGTCPSDTPVTCSGGTCCGAGTQCCPDDQCAEDCNAGKCPAATPADCLDGTCCAKECCPDGTCDTCGGNASDAAAE